MQSGRRRALARIAQVGANADFAGGPVGAREEILDPQRRTHQQLDRIDQPTALVLAAAGGLAPPAALRRVALGEAVDGLVGRAEHAYGDAVRGPWPGRLGHVERERLFAAFVASHVNIVEPHVGQVVDLPEAEQVTPGTVRIRGKRDRAPVPGHPMAAGQHLLVDARHADLFRVRPRLLPPPLIPADVLGIEHNQPVGGPVQRHDRRRTLRTRLRGIRSLNG
jgi:hypothetical protein